MKIVLSDGSAIECSRTELSPDIKDIIFDDVWVASAQEVAKITEG